MNEHETMDYRTNGQLAAMVEAQAIVAFGDSQDELPDFDEEE